MAERNSETQKKSRFYLTATTLGLNMAVGMCVFTFLGYWIDQKRGGGQGWTLAGMFLGLFYCGYEAWKTIKRFQNDSANNDEEEKASK